MANTDKKDDNTFPRVVYKKGTGKQVNDQGLYEAESLVVHDQKQLDNLGGDYVAHPKDAVTSKPEAKK